MRRPWTYLHAGVGSATQGRLLARSGVCFDVGQLPHDKASQRRSMSISRQRRFDPGIAAAPEGIPIDPIDPI